MRFWLPPTTATLTLTNVPSAAAWSHGGPAPDKVLAGAATGLGNIQGIATAGSGATFAANDAFETLTAYDGDRGHRTAFRLDHGHGLAFAISPTSTGGP